MPSVEIEHKTTSYAVKVHKLACTPIAIATFTRMKSFPEIPALQPKNQFFCTDLWKMKTSGCKQDLGCNQLRSSAGITASPPTPPSSHSHSPHSHSPHSHRPHSHSPHSHVSGSHRHQPHSHVPHRHSAHQHSPSKPTRRPANPTSAWPTACSHRLCNT